MAESFPVETHAGKPPKHVFGPVPSRRLGRSLGIDLVPFKTCSYDCIYCQLGRTTARTIERKEWFPLRDIVEEIRGSLDTKPDYITLSGSGEPTLYSKLGEVIDEIRSMTDIPVAVLTNGSLLWDGEGRSQLMDAHLVVPSLDAGDKTMFGTVNRPHPDITFKRMISGLADFRRTFHGALWLEIFILGGYTSIRNEAMKIADLARTIMPDRIQLNTVTRPPAEDFAVEVPHTRLVKLSKLFTPPAEVIADFSHVVHDEFTVTRDSVLNTVRRRPCTVDDISGGLGIHRHETLKHLGELLERGLIEKTASGGRTYYRASIKETKE
jgi:wyosine [tRNA(Phe)-imidazoG37] synthetase (radical SAM superfamily)